MNAKTRWAVLILFITCLTPSMASAGYFDCLNDAKNERGSCLDRSNHLRTMCRIAVAQRCSNLCDIFPDDTRYRSCLESCEWDGDDQCQFDYNSDQQECWSDYWSSYWECKSRYMVK